MMWGDPPQIQLGMDPSRSAESGMLRGFVMQAIGGLASERFQNPDQFKPMISRGLEQIDDAEDLDEVSNTLEDCRHIEE